MGRFYMEDGKLAIFHDPLLIYCKNHSPRPKNHMKNVSPMREVWGHSHHCHLPPLSKLQIASNCRQATLPKVESIQH